jgi:hypothetical protein
MKKNIIALLLFLSVFVFSNKAFAQTPECYKFKEGKFKIIDANAGGITVIERKGGYQIENNEGMKATLKFRVTWLDDCTYTLKLGTILRNENKIPFPTDMILKVKILATSKNFYTQESSSNLYSTVYKSEVVKIQ